jgi:hypothetical protein
MARLVLAPPHVQQSLDEIYIAPANVLHLHGTHRRVGGDDSRRSRRAPIPDSRRRRRTAGPDEDDRTVLAFATVRISTVREFLNKATGLLRSRTPILVTRRGRLVGI